MPTVVLIISFIFGAAIGSFLNVVIFRSPFLSHAPSDTKIKTGVGGRSHCPYCHQQLSAFELIPILSYVFLRGKCSKCHHRLSPQYPLVEATTGLIATLLLVPLSFLTLQLLAAATIKFTIACLLIILFVIDLHTLLLPDSFITLLTIFAIFSFWFAPHPLYSALLGSLIGTGFLLSLWLLTARRGIGLGDVKLMVPLGLIFGLSNTALLLLVSFIIGGFISLLLLISKKATFKTAVPFGPFLTGTAILFLLYPSFPQMLITWLV